MILVKNVTGQVFNSTIVNNKIEQKSMKSLSVITTNTKESFTNLSSVTDQVSNCSIIKNSTEQNCMKSPTEITTIANESMVSLQLQTNCLPIQLPK